jgi:hypothetical protein
VGILAAVAMAATGCSMFADGKDAVRDAAAAHIAKATYEKTTDAKTAKVLLALRATGAGTPVSISGDGVVDFGSRASDLTLTVPSLGTAAIRTVAGVSYIEVPEAFAAFTGGKPWVKLDPSTLGMVGMGQLADTGLTSPSDALAYLAGISDDVEKVGEETVAETKTTRYRVVLDLREAARKGNAEAIARAEALFGTARIPADVWLDEDGRLRKFEMRQSITSPGGASASAGAAEVSVSLTLPEFGVPVKVTAPPASQVADLGALTGSK